MTRKAKIWLTSTLGFSGYLGFAYSLPRWLSLPDQRAWLLFGLMAVLGLVAWLFTTIFLTKRQPAPPPPQDPLSLEMDAAITQTERRLVDARVARGDVLHKLPAVFVVGPQQHHKTSSVIRSGVHAELLAGDVLRGAQVVPTQTINTWFAGKAVVAEVGVDVAQAPERFARFLARFQPARLSNALASGVQAPRAVLVCYSCEALRLPGARDATLIAARELRGTLGTIAQSYGIRLPVYVLFTKADALPGFKEFARRFTADEVRDVLGATLPMTAEMRAAEYADRASQAYRTELLALFESLATRRVDVLAREDAAEHRLRGYQFPRELRKLEPLIADFLVELGRPSDLAASPFVRGFYFSGVREVVVSDGESPVVAAATRVSEEEGATALLGALPRPGATPAPSFALHGAGRREAQWVFLDRLLSQVVLDDAAALGITRGGTRISFFRRATLGAAAAAAALLIVAQLNAFAANARLQASVQRHTAAVVGLPTTPVVAPAVAELALLDSLGNSLDALSGYTWERTPVHLRWAMYQGDTLYGTTHAAYFRQFRRLLLDSTFASMASTLGGMSGTPQAGAQFASAYERLKAYLVISDSSTKGSDALADVLFSNWRPASGLDSGGRVLALRQFRRYARELPLRNPYPRQLVADQRVVDHARRMLQQAGSEQRIYLAILEDASDSIRGIVFNRDHASISRGTLSVPHPIPGAFTRAGYNFVSRKVENVDDYLGVESWVLGPATGPVPDERELKGTLRASYHTEFVEQWRNFVRSAQVQGFGSASDAAQKLEVLGGAASPIMQMFALVNEHTSVDSAAIGRFFDPIRKLGAARSSATAPDLMTPYLLQLISLSTQLRTVAGTPPAGQAPLISEALNKLGDGSTALNSVLRGASPLPAELPIQQLLDRPLQFARSVLQRDQARATVEGARGPVEDAGAAFCQSFSELSQRRPFKRLGDTGVPWASPNDLAAVLAPTNGSLAGVMQSELRNIFVRQGSRFHANLRAEVQPEPEALTFLNGLQSIADALYPPGAIEPQLKFSIAPVSTTRRSIITFDSQRLEFDRNRTEHRPIVWRLASDQNILIADPRNLDQVRDVPPEGGWTLLLFFSNGDWLNKGTNRWQFDYEFGDSLVIGFDVEMQPEVQKLVRQTHIEPPLVCPSRWVRR